MLEGGGGGKGLRGIGDARGRARSTGQPGKEA